jgi:hypothetical protein
MFKTLGSVVTLFFPRSRETFYLTVFVSCAMRSTDAVHREKVLSFVRP